MADGTIGITEGSGSKLDAEDLTVGSTAVKRERVQIAGSTAAAIQAVNNADPSATAYGGAVRLVGQVAHDAADIGSPVKVGGKTSNTDTGVSAAGDRTDAWFNLNGALMVHQLPFVAQQARLLGDSTAATVLRATSTSSSTSASSLIALTASTYIYVVGVTVTATYTGSNALAVTFQTSGASALWRVALNTQVPTYSVFAPQGLYLFKSNVADSIDVIWSTVTSVTNPFVCLHYVKSTVSI